MIKVLAHGDQHLQAVCPRCGCFFEFDREDIQHAQSFCPESSWQGDHSWIPCPECGARLNQGAVYESVH